MLNGKTDEKLKVNGIEIERVPNHKYLGKIVEEGNKEKEEIKERIKQARGKSNECLSIINNSKLRKKRIDVGLKLLKTEIIPVLTFGAETWSKLTEKEKHEIENIQTQYLAKVLRVPVTTPKCALLSEMDLMKIEHIENLRKLEYFVEISNRDEEKLEVKIKTLMERKEMSYIKEINDLKKMYNLNQSIEKMPVPKSRKLIKRAIIKKNNDEIKNDIISTKKTQKMTDNNKEYIRCENFKTARTIFMVYSDMIEVKANYKGSHKNTKCEACNKDEETTEHLIKCPKYEDITKELKNKSSVRNLMKENKPLDIEKHLKIYWKK